jgi:hypothetical protein
MDAAKVSLRLLLSLVAVAMLLSVEYVLSGYSTANWSLPAALGTGIGIYIILPFMYRKYKEKKVRASERTQSD